MAFVPPFAENDSRSSIALDSQTRVEVNQVHFAIKKERHARYGHLKGFSTQGFVFVHVANDGLRVGDVPGDIHSYKNADVFRE